MLQSCTKQLKLSTLKSHYNRSTQLDLSWISQRHHRSHGWAVVMSSIRACFLSLARSKLRLCSANHRAGYWINLPCDWSSTSWAYSDQETENHPSMLQKVIMGISTLKSTWLQSNLFITRISPDQNKNSLCTNLISWISHLHDGDSSTDKIRIKSQ